jgi:23S rRNA (guanosine2251-2'-O)-methyltransferase
MVGRKRRQLRRQRLMGSHQRSWLWGRHAVHETLVARRWTILELRLSEQLPPDQVAVIHRLAERDGIPVQTEPAERLTQLVGRTDHQGYLARMAEYPYRSLSELRESMPVPAAIAVLDAIQDPHNFGAILRSADVLGVAGVVIPRHEQCPVTAQVARSSAGAVNRIELAMVESLAEAARELRVHGCVLVGTDQEAELPVTEHDFTGPTAIVLGNEGRGLHAELRDVCDVVVRIPQCGHIGSLNVAVAAGILFYELARQRASAWTPVQAGSDSSPEATSVRPADRGVDRRDDA